jgi:hypothetical protein
LDFVYRRIKRVSEQHRPRSNSLETSWKHALKKTSLRRHTLLDETFKMDSVLCVHFRHVVCPMLEDFICRWPEAGILGLHVWTTTIRTQIKKHIQRLFLLKLYLCSDQTMISVETNIY